MKMGTQISLFNQSIEIELNKIKEVVANLKKNINLKTYDFHNREIIDKLIKSLGNQQCGNQKYVSNVILEDFQKSVRQLVNVLFIEKPDLDDYTYMNTMYSLNYYATTLVNLNPGTRPIGKLYQKSYYDDALLLLLKIITYFFNPSESFSENYIYFWNNILTKKDKKLMNKSIPELILQGRYLQESSFENDKLIAIDKNFSASIDNLLFFFNNIEIEIKFNNPISIEQITLDDFDIIKPIEFEYILLTEINQIKDAKVSAQVYNNLLKAVGLEKLPNDNWTLSKDLVYCLIKTKQFEQINNNLIRLKLNNDTFQVAYIATIIKYIKLSPMKVSRSLIYNLSMFVALVFHQFLIKKSIYEADKVIYKIY